MTMLSRLEAFRQRNNRQKMLKHVARVALWILLYMFFLLGYQSQQAHHQVIKVDLQHARDDWMEQFYRVQAFEMSKGLSRTERAQIKVEQRQAIKLWKHNQTSVVLRGTNTTHTASEESTNSLVETADYLITFFAVYMVARLILQILVFPRLQRTTQPSLQRNTVLQRANAVRFQRWANELNRQREAQGERPLSMEALRLVLRERQVNDGTDYEGLLEFQEQSGPAMEALLQSMGATNQEIERLPMRRIQSRDDLLQLRHGKRPECAICLEHFQVGDTVRTVPCFHAFHQDCIDPWLASKAVCPICKHSAIA